MDTNLLLDYLESRKEPLTRISRRIGKNERYLSMARYNPKGWNPKLTSLYAISEVTDIPFEYLLAICEGKHDFIPDMETRVQFTNKDFAEFIIKRHEIAMSIHRNPGSLYYGSLIYKTPVISNIKKDGDITYNSLAKTAKLLNETPLTLYLMVKAMKVHDILITSKTMLGFYEPYFKVVQDLGRGRKAEAK